MPDLIQVEKGPKSPLSRPLRRDGFLSPALYTIRLQPHALLPCTIHCVTAKQQLCKSL